MNDSDLKLVDYLKGSIDNLADKFDQFFIKQEETNREVIETKRIVAEHDTRLAVLEEPKDKWLQTNHPLAYHIIAVSSVAALTLLLYQLCPWAVHLLSGLVA